MRAAHSKRAWQLGDLLRRLDVLADAAVHAQDDAVHERAHRQPFEEEVEPTPGGDTRGTTPETLHALVEEPIARVDLG